MTYRLASSYFVVRCVETNEEENLATEKECLAWASRVKHVMGVEVSFVIRKIREYEKPLKMP
jgi:hypothetical protein